MSVHIWFPRMNTMVHIPASALCLTKAMLDRSDLGKKWPPWGFGGGGGAGVGRLRKTLPSRKLVDALEQERRDLTCNLQSKPWALSMDP